MFDTGLIPSASADKVAPGVGPGVGFEVAPGVGLQVADGCSVIDGRLAIRAESATTIGTGSLRVGRAPAEAVEGTAEALAATTTARMAAYAPNLGMPCRRPPRMTEVRARLRALRQFVPIAGSSS